MNRSARARARTSVYAGQVESILVRHVLAEASALVAAFPLVLISCIDGDPELPARSPLMHGALQKTGIRLRRTGTSLAVSGSELIEMQNLGADRPLQGHDEIWLFGDQRPVQSPPSGVTLIQRLGQFPEGYPNEAVPQNIEDWVHASGCVMGLADNDCDLTYVTIDPTLASYLDSFGRPRG